jgi:hypothetical protein
MDLAFPRKYGNDREAAVTASRIMDSYSAFMLFPKQSDSISNSQGQSPNFQEILGGRQFGASDER